MVIEHLTHQGIMDPALLYEQPFTTVAPTGPEQLFDDEKVTRLVNRFSPVARASLRLWKLGFHTPAAT